MNPERLKLLERLKAADLKNDVPSVSQDTAEFLHNLVLEHGCNNALEIGTAHAYSSIWIGDALEQNGGQLTTIEHSDPSFNQAKVNLYRTKLEKTVTQHQGKAQAIVPTLNQTFDFIFIDGQKTHTLDFFSLCAPLLNSNGIIVVDDVIKFKDKMTSFYQWIEAQKSWQYTIEKLDKDDGIMVITKA